MPSKAPRSSSRILPLALPTSSAGVPITVTVRPTSSATLAAATAAPTAEAAMILWPQAWPISGRQSYSAQMPMFRGPDPARARNAVGKLQTPFSTEKPASVSDSHSQDEAFSSSKPSSGCAWIRWLSSIKLLRASSKRSRAPDSAFMAHPSLLGIPIHSATTSGKQNLTSALVRAYSTDQVVAETRRQCLQWIRISLFQGEGGKVWYRCNLGLRHGIREGRQSIHAAVILLAGGPSVMGQT